MDKPPVASSWHTIELDELAVSQVDQLATSRRFGTLEVPDQVAEAQRPAVPQPVQRPLLTLGQFEVACGVPTSIFSLQ